MLTTGPGDDVLDVPTDAPQPAGALGTGVAAPRALLLNASGEPLCVVSLHRAVVLVMTGKATVLESEVRLLHSERAAIPLPVVLSLTRYVPVPTRRPVPPTRRTVLQRDDHRCAYCGGGADTVDHVLPRSRVICRGRLATRHSHHGEHTTTVLRGKTAAAQHTALGVHG